MSRYIDYNVIDYRNDRLHDKSEEFLNGVIYMAQRIEDAPTIDIVRCEECRHWWVDDDNMICHIHYDPTVPEHFCSYGEHKEIPSAK